MRDILPRLIRHRDAPAYLAMDRNRFDREIRPTLIAIPVGSRAIAFDRLDLDAWVDATKQAHGRAGRALGRPSSETVDKVADKVADTRTPGHQRPRHPRAATAMLPAPAKPARTARHRAGESGNSPSPRDSYVARARRAISALQQDAP